LHLQERFAKGKAKPNPGGTTSSRINLSRLVKGFFVLCRRESSAFKAGRKQKVLLRSKSLFYLQERFAKGKAKPNLEGI
jgi:hypothetical protein